MPQPLQAGSIRHRLLLGLFTILACAMLASSAASARRPRMGDVLYPQGLAFDSRTGKTYFTNVADNCRVFAVGPLGVIRHVAGTGSCTPSGDGGHARAAGLETPKEVAVSDSYVYIGGSFSVRRVERAHGGISTLVGDPRYNCSGWGYSGPVAAVGRTASEVGIAVVDMALDPVSGNLFVVDSCQRAIFEIDISTGEIITRYIGIGTSYWALGAIAINSTGEIYFVSEPSSQTVYKITGTTTAVHVAGTGSGGYSGNGGPATRATFDPIKSLAFDADDNLWIGAGSFYSHLMKVDGSGTLTTTIGSGGRWDWGGVESGPASEQPLTSIDAIDFDDDGNLLLADVGDRLIAAIKAPSGPSDLWLWLMNDRLGATEDERRGGRNPAINSCDQACVRDPVNTATGEYWEEISDLAIDGRGPGIDFARSYSSLNAGVGGPLSYGWTYAYAMALDVDADGYVSIQQENGTQIGFEPDGSGGYVATPGQFAALTQNRDGTYTLVRRQRETFRFAPDGRLTAVEDLNGYATTLGYDGSGRLETITDESGRTVTLSYDGADRIVGLRDAAGRTVEYAYDLAGDLVEVTDVRGESWRLAYDDHLLLTRTDPNGHLDLENTYSADGEVLSQADGESGVTRFAYDPGVTRMTSPEGRVTEYRYVGGQLIEKVEGAGTRQAATWRYEYDPVTRGVTKTTDPRGNAWTAVYNSAGLRTSTRSPLRHTTSTTYDGQGNVLTSTDELNVTTTMTYDAGGNPLTRSVPVSSQTLVWRFAYGDSSHPGDLTQATDPLGKSTSYAYDRYGNRTSATDPTGAQATSTYDLLGRVQTSVSPRGNESGADPADYTTSYAYDAAGNLLSQRDPLGDEQRWTYDRAGNEATATDEAGKQTRFAYDDADRLVQTTRPDATTLLKNYDADGLLTSTTNGAGKRTTYTHDALGRVETTTDPSRRTTTFGYDGAGNPTTVLDAAGTTTTNTYDASNRLTRAAYSDGSTPTATFGYDEAGRRTSITDATGTTSFTYDALGRLTQHVDGASRTIGYGYDAGSRLTTLTYANGRAVTRGYDDAGRLTSVRDWLGNTTAFAYDRDGHLTRTTFPSGTGLEDVRGYDDAGQLTGVTMKQGGATQASIAYDHDPRGLIAQAAQSGLPGVGTRDYTYTDLAELASENSDPYAHDAAGNLTTLASATSLSYDDAGQLLRGPVPPGSARTDAEFSYDQRGSRTAARPVGGTATTYAYDQAERLRSFTPAGGATTTYAYDGGGLRVAKTTSGTTTRFTWDRGGSLPLLLSDGANSYVYGPSGPLAHITSGGAVRYYHQDALGSTRALSDDRGATVGAFSYAPYGTLTASSGTETTPLGYAGEYTDAESGLQYLRARSYDPATGQFLTRDPLVDETGEPYAYADGDPIGKVDPTGNSAWDRIGTRFVGAVDRMTFGATGAVRDRLGLNGGLDKCSFDYRAAQGVMGVAMGGAEFVSSFAGFGMMRLAARGVQNARRYTPDQNALIQLAKEAKRRGGLTEREGDILRQWGQEYGVPVRGPEAHRGRGFGSKPHYHVGPVQHILRR